MGDEPRPTRGRMLPKHDSPAAAAERGEHAPAVALEPSEASGQKDPDATPAS
jgi:hypothetical protein